MEPLAQTCMEQKMKLKILGKMHKPKINDKFGQKNEYRLFLLLTFTKQGDKITNANKMIYRVFVRCTKYKANRLTCFVRVSFPMAAVPQKRGQVSVCFSVTGETCYSGVASGKNGLVCSFLLKARSSQYF
ncbi:hypothetical protein [Hominenteromicrobium sp.]|uniref:hypothetical protein n=1 Tax=Hominenteromicrobium sp. TaxID=3073581 RepID=UPI003AB69C5C